MGAPKRRFIRLFRIAVSVLLSVAMLIGVKAIQNRRDTVPVDPIAWLPALATADAPGECSHAESDGPRHGQCLFRIVDPYDVPGEWRKAQLHTHTSHSLDSRRPPEEALQAYLERGYSFVALADHDTITRPQTAPAGLLLIPAEEDNINFPFWPLGQHAVYLFIDERVDRGGANERFAQAMDRGSIISIAHPNWEGGLGTGRWEMRHIMAAPQFQLIEVYNPHSDSGLDTRTWHEILVRRGPQAPVWAVAVDDAHDAELFDAGWTMVKVEAMTLAALKESLLRGSIYATTGPVVTFGVSENGAIVVAPGGDGGEDRYEVSFISSSGDVVARHTGPLPAAYPPEGSEGFVRVEVRSIATDGRAWSQPFWLIPADAGRTP